MQFDQRIEQIERWVGCRISEDYRAVLAAHGGEILGDSVLIYDAGDVVERNETFDVKTYCPGFLTIGDDSGGRAFVISPSISPAHLFAVDHGSIHPADFHLISDDLVDWIRRVYVQ